MSDLREALREADRIFDWLERRTIYQDGDIKQVHAKIRAALAEPAQEYPEAAEVCAEAYQVVGSMLSDLGQFNTERAAKVLDNLSQHRKVHDDVLPWPSFEPATKTLTDEQIDRIAENCAKGMPDGIQGFCKTWGWRQFARELLDVCAGYSRAAEPAQEMTDERRLRRLLCLRIGGPLAYMDDGEASFAEHGISIDFLRESAADIEAKVRALNVARAIAADRASRLPEMGEGDWPKLPEPFDTLVGHEDEGAMVFSSKQIRTAMVAAVEAYKALVRGKT